MPLCFGLRLPVFSRKYYSVRRVMPTVGHADISPEIKITSANTCLSCWIEDVANEGHKPGLSRSLENNNQTGQTGRIGQTRQTRQLDHMTQAANTAMFCTKCFINLSASRKSHQLVLDVFLMNHSVISYRSKDDSKGIIMAIKNLRNTRKSSLVRPYY